MTQLSRPDFTTDLDTDIVEEPGAVSAADIKEKLENLRDSVIWYDEVPKTGSAVDYVSGTAGVDNTIATWSATGDLVSGGALPSGSAVGTTDTQTLTNKTIDTASNTIVVVEADISDLQSYLLDIVSDTTPQLGGSLDVNGNSIISVTNGDINITPDGTGQINLDGVGWPTAVGTIGQVPTLDANGDLIFATPSGGGGGGTYTQEELEDITAEMFTGGTQTHSLISFVYDDANGEIDGIVEPNLSAYTNDIGFVTSATSPVTSVATKTGAIVLDGADITTGTFPDARVAETNVTQHQAALSIAAGQLTGTIAGVNIAAEAVSVDKLQHINTARILGRTSAGIGDVEVLDGAAVRGAINVEDGATADQTGAEIKVAYEAEADTNAFADADVTKLGLAVPSNIAGISGADQITNMVSLTQVEYDAIGTPDASTFYVIAG